MSEQERLQAVSLRKLLLAKLDSTSDRRLITRILLDLPYKRPRTSGPVGPELDYSVWFSIIPISQVAGNGPLSQSELYWFRKHAGQEFVAPNWDKKCLHNHVNMVNLVESAIAGWTKWAMAHNVRFDGDRKYIFPGRRTLHKWRKHDFVEAKSNGNVPCEIRSHSSRRRRAEKRRLNKRDPVKKGNRAKPQPMILSYRPVSTHAALRRSWINTKDRPSWKDFLASCEKRLVLQTRHGPVAVDSHYVYSAIRRLHQNEVVDKGKSTFPVPNLELPVKPDYDRIRSFEDFESFLLRKLNHIELSGFKDRWGWFSTNRQLELLRATHD